MKRCEDLKKQRLDELLKSTRLRIESLHATLNSSDEQRKQSLSVQEADDDLTLAKLEEEQSRLQARVDSIQSLLKLLAQRASYKSALAAHLASSAETDSSRLLQRNSYKVLANEEKMRQLQAVQLPRLEQKIIVAVQQWQSENNEVFMFKGEPYLEVLNAELEKDAAVATEKKRTDEEAKQKRKLEKMGIFTHPVQQQEKQTTPNQSPRGKSQTKVKPIKTVPSIQAALDNVHHTPKRAANSAQSTSRQPTVSSSQHATPLANATQRAITPAQLQYSTMTTPMSMLSSKNSRIPMLTTASKPVPSLNAGMTAPISNTGAGSQVKAQQRTPRKDKENVRMRF